MNSVKKVWKFGSLDDWMFGVMVEEDVVLCRRVGRNSKIIYSNEQARQPGQYVCTRTKIR